MKMKMKMKIAAGTHPTEANFIDLDKLTEDLILELLSHLPPISLLRFKSVSKTWYSLISNPDFLRCNTANQFDKRWLRISDPPPPPSILLKRYFFAKDSGILVLSPPNDNLQSYYYCHQNLSPLLLQKLIYYRPEHDDENGKFKVIDSCNGLLLYKYIIPPLGGENQLTLYVCNPLTQDYIKLPTLFEEQEETKQGFGILSKSTPSIVFDPSVSFTYKVVTWLTCKTIDRETISSMEKEENHYRLYVYSSETRSWRLSVSTNQLPVPDPFTFNWKGVLCNGILYWTTKCPFFHTDVSLRHDVEKGVTSTLNLPKMPLDYSYRALLYFGECGGRICLIETYFKQLGEKIDAFPFIFDVMELNNNDDLWTVKYRVNIGHDQGGYYAKFMRIYKFSLFDVRILDLYKTKTKKAAGEDEIHQGDQEEELLLNISNLYIIPFNLSSNTFGMPLRNEEKKSVGECLMGFISVREVLRYNTITLFPLSSSS